MKHSYLKHILLCLCLFIGTKASAYDAYIGNGIYYNFSGNEAIVTSGDYEYSGNVVIPESVTYNGRTYSVTTIDSDAFYNCSGLTSITIPTTLKMVKANAFNGCTSLAKVIVKDIAAWCGIIYDGGSAFANVNSPLFYAQHLYSDENTEITEVVIPEGVTRIEARAFRDAKFITSITIPSSVTYIGMEAFRGMHRLTSINIPHTLTSIEPYTFQDCRSLSSFSIPNGVTSIGYHAFRECLTMTSITIPQSVTTIGASAFKNCPCLNDFYCYAVDIPVTDSGVFTSSPINSATLHVPGSSLYQYKVTSPWSGFGSIVAIGDDVSTEEIEIASAENLANFAARVNAGETSLCAVLTADIDLNGVTWTPIGNANTKYAGSFDGQGHAITGLNYTATTDYNGLFGYINNATIKNFSISGTLTSTYNHNGVVGNADGVSLVSGIHSSLKINVSNCKAHTGGVVGGSGPIGHTLLVENCEYNGTLTHSGEGDCQAGILGYTRSGGVRNCIFSGTIIGENSMYGGILAYCKESSFRGVQNCLSVGKIVATEECTTAAAIIANWNGDATANVKNNYYCFQEGSTTTTAIGNNTQNCEAPHKVTAKQLASGEICYKLNGDQTEINWYQTLGDDAFPVPDNRHLAVMFVDGAYTNGPKYTITFDTNSGSPIESITQFPGTAITPPEDPTREGYTFMGWKPAIPETMPENDLTVTAQWQVNSYIITYIVDGNVYKTDTIAYGTELTPEPIPTKEGYAFSGWSYIPPTMPAGNIVVMGSFTINSYTLTYMVDGEEYKTSTLVYGSEIIPEEEPTKEGYTFSGWSEIPETMPAGDVVITGSFTVNSYTLLYIIDGEEYKTSSVAYGTTITPEAEPTKEGYTFSGWSEIPETMPAEDVTVTGSFIINQYLLTYVIDGEEYKSYEIDYNSALTPEPAPTKKGMTFSGWGDVPETMPAHDVTLTGTYSWSRETIEGVVYQVTDTLSNYASVVGYDEASTEATILSDVEIDGYMYEVSSIENGALPKTVTINISVGKLLLWLWNNGYEDIREIESSRNLAAPEISLVSKTASSLTLAYTNEYPEFCETVIVNNAPVEKGNNGYEVALKGLEPDNLYEGLASLTLNLDDASYTKAFSFSTEPLSLDSQQPKVINLGNVVVAAKSNLDDRETGVGFEWRRIDWTDDFASNFGAAYLYEGTIEGYIRSLNTDKLWKYRAYYEANTGNRYYSQWIGIDPSNTSYFEPTVHTYSIIDLIGNMAEIWGYVMRGTDNITIQGFIYWNITLSSSSRKNANGIPANATKVLASGNVMSAKLENLEYETEYCYVAFVTTSEGETFYGEPQMFRTGEMDPDGIKEIESLTPALSKGEGVWYSLDGKKLDKPQRGINIIRYSDGSTRKVLVK